MKLLSSLLVAVLTNDIVDVEDAIDAVGDAVNDIDAVIDAAIDAVNDVDAVIDAAIDAVVDDDVDVIDPTQCHDFAGQRFRIFDGKDIDTNVHTTLTMFQPSQNEDPDYELNGLDEDENPNCAAQCADDKDCLFFTFDKETETCQFGVVQEGEEGTMFKR